MIVSDIVENGNFNAEFPYAVRITDGYGEIILEFKSWEDDLPEEVLNAEVIYLTVVNGYDTLYNTAVMLIEIYQPEIY